MGIILKHTDGYNYELLDKIAIVGDIIRIIQIDGTPLVEATVRQVEGITENELLISKTVGDFTTVLADNSDDIYQVMERIYEDSETMNGKNNEELIGKSFDNVKKPSHYNKSGKFETIEVIEEFTKGYKDGFVAHCVGTSTKYNARAPHKHDSPLEDLKKSREYLTFAIEYLEKKNGNS